jgi:predicted nucleic acid-binding protein
MEMTVTKIIDNTVITAGLSEIESINLFDICSTVYKLATSSEVYAEAVDGFDEQELNLKCKSLLVLDLARDSKYINLKTFLQNRYPYLGLGEISSFLVALLEYEIQNRAYYYVTDDQRMRKVIAALERNEDLLFIKALGGKIARFKDTGTIGLLIKLCQKGTLSSDSVDDIANELERGTFRITPDLTKQLKECHNET